MGKQGIYVIRNTVSGRVYVGSSKDIKQRFALHRKRLNGGYHVSKRFQASWTKHGARVFEFQIVEIVDSPFDLHAREQHWIDALGAIDPDRGFNVRGTVEGTLGFVHSAEAVEKIRASSTGRRHTPESKAKLSLAHKGRSHGPHSEATKEALRSSSRAWASTPENRAKISKQMRDRVVSQQTRQRQSIALTGRTHSPVTKAKLRAANLGKKHTDETRTKQSVALKGRKRSAQAIALSTAFWTGRKHSEEAKAKMSAAATARIKGVRVGYWAGKTRPAETRAKMTESHKARWATLRAARHSDQPALPLAAE